MITYRDGEMNGGCCEDCLFPIESDLPVGVVQPSGLEEVRVRVILQ